MGNYNGDKQRCGYLDPYKQKNIYDMAGNVDEWTMEKETISTETRRITEKLEKI